MAEQYLIRSRGKVQGPFTPEELRSRAKRGRFSRLHQVSTDGVNWYRATEFPELFPPPPQPRIHQQPLDVPDAEAVLLEPLEELVDDQSVEAILEPEDEYPVAGTETAEESTGGETEPLWYYCHNGVEGGPVPLSQLQFFAASEQIIPSDLVWTEGMPDWTEAYRVPGIFLESASTQEHQAMHAAEASTTSPMAVASFVLGLLGTSFFFFLGSIAAVVFGHVAIRQIQASQNTLAGRGMAVAGLVLGYIVIIATTLVGVVVMCLYLLRDALVGPG